MDQFKSRTKLIMSSIKTKNFENDRVGDVIPNICANNIENVVKLLTHSSCVDDIDLGIDVASLSPGATYEIEIEVANANSALEVLVNEVKEGNKEINGSDKVSEMQVVDNGKELTEVNIDGATMEDESFVLSENRKRRRNSERKEWKRNKAKNLRLEGEMYIGRTLAGGKTADKMVEERRLKPRCDSQVCKNSKKRFCSEISEEKRMEMFTLFWKDLSWDQRKVYFASLVDCVEPKQKRRAESGDRRGSTNHYYLKVNNDRKEVCREMFCNTFSIGVWSARNWAGNVKNGITPKKVKTVNIPKEIDEPCIEDSLNQDKTELSFPIQTKPKASKQFAKQFIDSLPKMESHYCRRDSSKLYLETIFQTMQDLYRLYIKKSEEAGFKALSRFTFNEILHELNVSLFKPKKDQCDICCQYKLSNLPYEIYSKHILAKNKAREEKENDKKLMSGLVLSVDVQAVKLAPFVQASALYFKTKLCCHNYTVYNLKTHEVDCYWWTEVEGELKASVFSSFLVNHIEKLVNNWPNDKARSIIIWSDGCCYQNKNKMLANALLEIALRYNFTIEQKYLQVGHTQMEVDSVHALIERKLKNRDIHLPSDYVSASKEARQKPSPYRAHYISFDFFKDYSITNGLRYSSIRPGNKAWDPTVNDVCHYIYQPDGTIKFRLSFEEEPQVLPRRNKSIPGDINYPPLYADQLKIKLSKFMDLQELKGVIHKDAHPFYDALPHQ